MRGVKSSFKVTLPITEMWSSHSLSRLKRPRQGLQSPPPPPTGLSFTITRENVPRTAMNTTDRKSPSTSEFSFCSLIPIVRGEKSLGGSQRRTEEPLDRVLRDQSPAGPESSPAFTSWAPLSAIVGVCVCVWQVGTCIMKEEVCRATPGPSVIAHGRVAHTARRSSVTPPFNLFLFLLFSVYKIRQTERLFCRVSWERRGRGAGRWGKRALWFLR